MPGIPPSHTPFWHKPLVIMLCGAAVFMLSAGTRQSFGLFQVPLTSELGWGREAFSLPLALMTLIMGLVTPFMGGLADRYGTGWVVLFGGVFWAVGLYGMSLVTTPWMLTLSAGLLLGLGTAATSVSIAMGGVGRMVPERFRGRALGVVAAGGSIGQMLLLPISQQLIESLGWRTALALLALGMVVMVPAAFGLSFRSAAGAGSEGVQTISQALGEARKHSGYLLLMAGFFVCGFHVSFIQVHLPAFAVDKGLSPKVGAYALMLVGLFNILGSYTWSTLGDRFRRKRLLSVLYLSRALLISVFLLLPVTPAVVLTFSSVMGFLWLGTVPLTSALVGEIFGVRYLSTLFGIVFTSHQVGGFLGAWLGGRIFDATGSYDLMWYFSIALGVFSALVHAPIDDRPVERIGVAADQGPQV